LDTSYFAEAQKAALAARNDASLKTTGSRAFYVSTSSGSASNVNAAEGAPSNNLQAVLDNASPGSSVYLCNGDTFYGQFTIRFKDNITIGPYECSGSANKNLPPMITAAITLSEGPRSVVTTKDGRLPMWVFDLKQVLANAPAGSVVGGVWNSQARYIPARFPNLVNRYDMRGMSASEFIFAETFGASNVTVPSSLKKIDSAYWKGATMRIRETDWNYRELTVTDVNTTSRMMLFGNGQSAGFWAAKPGFYLEHGIEELDAAGEYFFDDTANLLYVVPLPENANSPRSMSVALRQPRRPGQGLNDASNAPAALSITQSHGASVYGIHFDSVFRAISIDKSNRTTLVYVAVTNALAVAIAAPANSEVLTVSRCYFANLDTRGVTNAGRFGTVSRNVFRNIGMIAGYTHQPFGITGFVYGSILNNTILNSGYGAINPSPNCLVQGNVITGVGQVLADFAAIYAWGLYTNNVTVRSNTIVGIWGNILSASPKYVLSTGIYADDCSNNWTIEDNYVDPQYPLPAPAGVTNLMVSSIYVHNAFDNIIRNNVMIGWPLLIIHDQNGFTSHKLICEPLNNTITSNKYFYNTIRNDKVNPALSVTYWPWAGAPDSSRVPVASKVVTSYENNTFYRSSTSAETWPVVAGLNDMTMTPSNKFVFGSYEY
jgi:predicted lipoprotein with Yx(FWY)xxD motif